MRAASIPLTLGACWLMAASAPVSVSLAAVFLCAGPHNYFELRYFLERMPPRWGSRSRWYATALAGVLGLSFASIVLACVRPESTVPWSIWSTALLAWTLWLCALDRPVDRSRPDGRDWLWPAAPLVLAAAWLAPRGLGLALIYLHPCLALWMLDREVQSRRPTWRRLWRVCLWSIPVLIAGLIAVSLLSSEPVELSHDHPLATRADWGAAWPSNPLPLLTVHAFLELLHYAVWIVAIPNLAFRAPIWSLRSIPLSRPTSKWQRPVTWLVVLSGLGCCLLWMGLVIDYSTVFRWYFIVAIVHVLAEIPFLVRAR